MTGPGAWLLPLVLLSAPAIAAGAPFAATDDDDQPVQELFVGETVYVQDRHEVQVTAGFDYGKSGPDHSWTATEVVQYGISGRLELDAEAPLQSAPGTLALRAAGLHDVELGLLLGVARNVHAGALSVGLRGRVPTGHAREPAGGEAALEPILIAARALGRAQVHASGEVAFAFGSRSREWTYGIGAFVPLGRLRATLELDDRKEGDEHRALLTPGLYLKPTRSFEIGAAVPVGLTRRADDLGAILLATLEFGGRKGAD